MLVDRVYIESLRQLEKKPEDSLVNRLMDIYREKAPELISGISKSLEDQQLENLGRYAHSLKSSSGNLGAVHIQSICEELERITMIEPTNDLEEIRRLVADLKDNYQETLGLLAKVQKETEKF